MTVSRTGSRTAKTEMLDRLMDTFRYDGYDGASLAELSAVTGLGRSSLYHHFPGGKSDMALQVLAHMSLNLERDLLAPIRGAGTPQTRLDAMLCTLTMFYDQGRKSCLLERLCASVEAKSFRAPLTAAFHALIGAVHQLCEEAGVPRAVAAERAEDAVIRIQGALIVGAGLADPEVFTRTLARLGVTLLRRGDVECGDRRRRE